MVLPEGFGGWAIISHEPLSLTRWSRPLLVMWSALSAHAFTQNHGQPTSYPKKGIPKSARRAHLLSKASAKEKTREDKRRQEKTREDKRRQEKTQAEELLLHLPGIGVPGNLRELPGFLRFFVLRVQFKGPRA